MNISDKIKGIKIATNLISAAGLACIIGPIAMNRVAKRNTEVVFNDDKKENDKVYMRKAIDSELAKYYTAINSSSSIEDIQYSYEEYLESYKY